MKERLGYLVAMLLLSLQFALAQNVQVSGKVVDKNGEPIVGVVVMIKGTQRGTATDENGEYKLNAERDNILQYLLIGMKTKEVTVGSSSTINVTLEEDSQELDDVVVIGYGSGRKLGTVVGSAVKVSAQKIEDQPTNNPLDALQGKVSGLQIFTSSGEPSALSSIRLHGTGSLSSSSTPLFILDGMPIDPSTIQDINPHDIESVTVLKDASATSIYGSRAANGVLYITTKQGRTGEGNGTINIKYQYGISKMANQDYYDSFMNSEELTDLWVNLGLRTRAYVDNLLAQYPYNTRWDKYYYKDSAPMHQADVSFSGGTRKGRYYISASYSHQEGLAYRSDFERFTLRTNLSSDINSYLKVGANITLGYNEYQSNPYGNNSTNRGLAMLAPPYYTPYDENGNEYDYIPGWNRYSPKYLANKTPYPRGTLSVIPTGYLQLTPVKGLTLKSQGGLELKDYKGTYTRLPSYLGSLDNGSRFEESSRTQKITATNTAEYRFSIDDKHNFAALLGQEWIDYQYTLFSAEGAGLTDDRLIQLSQTTTNKAVEGQRVEWAFSSLFGRLEYNLNEKYFADLSVRRDGSSRFGSNNRFATFWAIGGMWNISKEAFLAKYHWINNLNVKFSYGTSGNAEIGNYASYATVGTKQYDSGIGYTLSSAGDPNLSWEEQSKTTFGVELEAFNRLNLNVEVYKRNTKNMLVSVPQAYTTGWSSITKNVGAMQNTGIDIQLDVTAWKQGKNHITPYVNFNYNQDKITELFQGRSYWIVPNTGIAWVVGKPVTYFYPIWKGVNPDNGDAQWYMPGSDISVKTEDPNNVSTSFSSNLEQNTGIKRYAPVNGGWGVNAAYKGFTLQADFAFSLGKYLIVNDNYFFENPSVFLGYNQRRTVNDFWTQDNKNARFPRADVEFTQFDSRLISNASFMRLKTLSIGYTIPNKFLGGSHSPIKGAKIFAVGRNLLTFTDFNGIDPEVDTNLTLGVNPNTKQYTVGIELTL